MLQQLIVENYTLIRFLSIEFDRGFTVITGETGAGKSILIGALSLILGNRADTNVLLDPSKKCIIEGVFDARAYGLESFFRNNDLDFDETITIRREISPAGKSRAFVNDTPVNLSLLRELAENLVDIHSQHAILHLNDADFQLGVVDEYAANTSQLKLYQSAYRDVNALQSKLRHLQQQEADAIKDRDYLSYLFEELKKARLQPNEKESLESELEVQLHAEEIKGNLHRSLELLGTAEINVLSNLAEIAGMMKKNGIHHPASAQILHRLEEVLIELRDIEREITHRSEELTYDAERIEQLNQRLSLIYNLEQKHNVTGTLALMELMKQIDEKLEAIESFEESIVKLKKQIQQSQLALNRLDVALTDSRLQVLPVISDELTRLVRQLGMQDAEVRISLSSGGEQGLNGSDIVMFLFNANKGGLLREVAEIASGGELSRLMLAVKYILSAKKKLPTVVFDEIDIGISGEIAAKMGLMMKEMAESMQLITITHLPQIAGKATNHLLVYKETGENSTLSNIKKLSTEDRVMEIAKMLSDEHISELSVMKARELLR
jgi:DNA repair protein RecN (Recombination protein N)